MIWVKFRPIKQYEDDLVLVNRPKSDWLQELYRVDKAVQKKDLEGAKIGAYFSVVDRVDPKEKDWRRIILKKFQILRVSASFAKLRERKRKREERKRKR